MEEKAGFLLVRHDVSGNGSRPARVLNVVTTALHREGPTPGDPCRGESCPPEGSWGSGRGLWSLTTVGHSCLCRNLHWGASSPQPWSSL